MKSAVRKRKSGFKDAIRTVFRPIRQDLFFREYYGLKDLSASDNRQPGHPFIFYDEVPSSAEYKAVVHMVPFVQPYAPKDIPPPLEISVPPYEARTDGLLVPLGMIFNESGIYMLGMVLEFSVE